jgi:regulator of protease activity HflC (stomatin/prohibitin superfamily)
METAFAWLGQIFDALLQLVPRRVIVRATEGGVKWSLWFGPKEMKPGIRIYWPLISDIEVIVVARQTLNTPTQSLMTSDGETVVAGGVIIYKISDVVQAIGKANWCPETTAGDIVQAALVEIVASHECDFILKNISGVIEEELTLKTREQLRRFGVYVGRAALADFSTVRQLNHSGIAININTV